MLCMSIASMLVAILFPLTGAVAMPGVMALFAGLGLAIQGALVFRRRGNITPLP
jgi:hypothetical protein